MLQRKQSVYLLVAAILSAVCMFLPIGSFVSENMGADAVMYNIAIKSMNGSMDYSVCVLFILLMVNVLSTVINIFLFKNRKLQSTLCKANMVVILLWYVGYAYFGFNGIQGAEFSFSASAIMPFIALLGEFLANRGIRADEELIRSMDRIR